MEVIGIRTASLGDATYILTIGEHAVIIDPQRDIGRFIDVLDERGLTLTHVLEILHHEQFQKMESAWRGLKLVVDRTNFRENVKLELLNISKEEL